LVKEAETFQKSSLAAVSCKVSRNTETVIFQFFCCTGWDADLFCFGDGQNCGGFPPLLRFVWKNPDLPLFLSHLRTAFFEAHLLSPYKIWQLWVLTSYKVFMEPSYTIITPYYFSNERRFSVDSSLQCILSYLLLWKQNDSSKVIQTWSWRGKHAASVRACLREANAEQ